jgi:hypothetical protein
VEGDDHGEAYTAIEWSGLLSRERYKPAGAETVENVEGNMLRTVMRGATALPWSCQATRKWAPFGDNTDSAEGSIPLDRRGRRGASTAWKTHVP